MRLDQGARLGAYEILAPLGAGGMGEVYKARDTRLDRTVAIKILPSHLSESEELRQRFEQEARAISSLNHPHICTLYDIGNENGVDFMVMEHLEGQTLADRLKKGPLPLDEALRHGRQIADALEKAHREGVIHRDLKPGNIIITKTGAKLLDFGLAKMGKTSSEPDLSAVTEQKPLTEKGAILETFQYMSPEQLEGKEVDARTDVFALGAVLYEMVTGKKAFEGKSQASLISAIMTSEPPPPSSLQPLTPAHLDAVIRTCLAKDPDDRWQSVGDVALPLEWVASASSPAETPSGNRLAWGLAMALGLASLVLAAVLLVRSSADRPVRRFHVLPSKGTSFAQRLALSPHGDRLVFLAEDADGTLGLWLRAFDALEAQPLAGTEGANDPFWSPDGRFIAFFADNKLMKLALDGGRVDVLCDAGTGRGGTWGPDDVIVFTPQAGKDIMRVSAAGGVPQSVTTVDDVRRIHLFPAFLPDGNHFLYQEISAESLGIYVASLDSTERKLLLELESVRETTSVAFSPTGHLLFVRSGSLMAQTLDLDRFELTGEPLRIAENVWRSGNGQAAFAVSQNGVLAYMSRGEGRATELVWYDRDGRPTGRVGTRGPYTEIALSPDEDRLAVTRGSSPDSLWILDAARGTATVFDEGGWLSEMPVWAPDGTSIIFASDRIGAPDLYRKPLSRTGDAELLLQEPRVLYPTDWSSDGRLLAFQRADPDTRDDIGILRLDEDGEPRMLLRTPAAETDARFSPDGRYLSYVSDETGRPEVYVARLPDLDETHRVSTGGGNHPRWRGDGTELYYLEGEKVMTVDVRTEPSFQSGIPRVLFEAKNLFGDQPYDVSGDGERFLMNIAVGEPEPQPITVVLNWTAELETR